MIRHVDGELGRTVRCGGAEYGKAATTPSEWPPSEELIWFQKAEKAIFHYTQFISKNSRAEVLDELLVGSQG